MYTARTLIGCLCYSYNLEIYDIDSEEKAALYHAELKNVNTMIAQRQPQRQEELKVTWMKLQFNNYMCIAHPHCIHHSYCGEYNEST